VPSQTRRLNPLGVADPLLARYRSVVCTDTCSRRQRDTGGRKMGTGATEAALVKVSTVSKQELLYGVGGLPIPIYTITYG